MDDWRRRRCFVLAGRLRTVGTARTSSASPGAAPSGTLTVVSDARRPEVSDAPAGGLLIPAGTAPALAGAPGNAVDFTLPESITRLGRVALLAYAAEMLDQMDEAVARGEITNAMTRFSLNPDRPEDVMAASAYVWANYNLGFYTSAQFSGPALDAAAQAVMRCVLLNPRALPAMLQRSPSQGAEAFSLIVGAANAGLADYIAESSARPAGVAPELQTTSRSARAAIAEQLKTGRMQAHHLVPAYNWGVRVDISALAAKAKWKVDSPSNLIALPADLAAQAEYQGTIR